MSAPLPKKRKINTQNQIYSNRKNNNSCTNNFSHLVHSCTNVHDGSQRIAAEKFTRKISPKSVRFATKKRKSIDENLWKQWGNITSACIPRLSTSDLCFRPCIIAGSEGTRVKERREANPRERNERKMNRATLESWGGLDNSLFLTD